ncbi:MAG TPA: sugar ABC transporter substrate-binding protein, partial [Chloroflexota bacterium]|nr:sugar ABC transporter substrate-binding protein [Chloroflexota bacterium]
MLQDVQQPRQTPPQVTQFPRATRRALLGTAAAMGGALGVAACGAGGSAPSTATAAKGKVLFWQWGAGYVDGFTALVKEYNDKNTGVTVDFDASAVTSGSSDYWVKLTAAMAGNVGPDAFLMNTNARTWSTQGQLRPVDDLIKKDKSAQDSSNATIKVFKEWYDVNGKQMGWPWDYSTIVSYYNVGYLKEAGLKLPSELGDKWDWNTYREYAQKLTRPGQRWGTHVEPGYESGWLNFVRANGGDYFSEDRKKCILGDQKCIEAIEYLQAFVTKDRYAPTRQETSAKVAKLDMFINGEIASYHHGDWQMTDIRRRAASNLEWDVAPIPFRNGKTGNSANLRGVVINSQSKSIEQAWEWMKFLLTKPVQDRVPTLFGEVPARLDSANEVYANP